MSDSLVPIHGTLPLDRAELLTRQFYDWEIRGRGWRVFSFPVQIEPPFRGVYFYDSVPEGITDDAHIPTFLSRMFGGDNSPKAPLKPTFSEQQLLERIAELDEPTLCDYYEEDFVELQIILAKDRKVGKPFVNQFVASASFCTNPISFEVVGTADSVVVQMAATERDLPQLRQQLAAYFPDARFIENRDSVLEDSWECCVGLAKIVDFGLSDEFLIPLDSVSNLDLDPLVSIIAGLSELQGDEIGILQILFQKTRSDWAPEIMDAVRFSDGTPVFSNAPEMIPNAKQKLSSPLYAAVIRVAAKADGNERVWQIVRGISAGMAQLSTPSSNELIPLSNDDYPREYHEQALLRRLSFRCGMILNLDELVSLVHPPSVLVRSEKLVRDTDGTKAAPVLTRGHSLVLGENLHQGQRASVTLSDEQRTRHLHLIGSSGSGKSTMLLSMIRQDLVQGRGVCVIDPHGDLIDAVTANVPEDRLDDVILFDPSDEDHPVGFNILQARSLLEKNLLSSDLVSTFRRMSTSWGDVMDSVLANAILAFLESSRGGTLFDLRRFLVEKAYREEHLKSVTDDGVVYFWENEFPLIGGKPQASILIRLDAFLRQSLIRNIVCQTENKLDFRGIMDERKILLVKLSQGLIGEENAYLLGTMLVSRLYQSALSRQDSEERPHFWLYLDEFHHFITPSMERILAGTRKYNLGLILAHQEFRQMQSRSQEVASSVLSNCYTRVCFRLGDNDAEKFAGGFSFFDARALQNLGVGEAIARVERAEYDFNLKAPAPAAVSRDVEREQRLRIVDLTREKYGRPRSEVEQELKAQLQRSEKRVEVEPQRVKNDQPRKDRKVEPETIPAPDIETRRESKGIEVPATPNSTVDLSETIDVPVAEQPTQQHRYLQALVKKMAENKGFKATLEKPLFGGAGRVDVALESDVIRIACEISVTNEPNYELQNVQKCLAGGFEKVVLISADERNLGRIRKLTEQSLTSDEIARIDFLTPEAFYGWLQSLPTDGESVGKVRGYKVKTKMKPVDEGERSTRKKAISEVVFGALKRLKNRSDDK
jgi:hypothetical protein